MPDTRGDVLCPTCGLWTPPAPYCTECGAVLQVGFQEPASGGSDVFRRGHEVDQPGAPWSQAERFEPEPEDEAARSAAAGVAGAAAAGRIDHFAEVEPPWPPEPGLVSEPPAPEEASTGAEMGAAAATAAAMSGLDEDVPPVEPKPAPKRKSRSKAATAAAAAGAAVGAAAADDASAAGAAAAGAAVADDATAVAAAPTPEPPPVAASAPPPPPPVEPPVTYAEPPRDGGDDDNSGVSGIVFIAFLGLGVLALMGGAILGGVFDGPAAQASPTPSNAISTPTPEPSLAPSPSGSAAPSTPAPSVLPTPTPVPPADGFIARVEPCAEPPSDPTCENSGAVNDGEVWILVSFRHAVPTDSIGIAIANEAGSVQDERTLSLSFCGSNTDCAGYAYDPLPFGPYGPGDYDVRVTRNGAEVATTEFTVE